MNFRSVGVVLCICDFINLSKKRSGNSCAIFTSQGRDVMIYLVFGFFIISFLLLDFSRYFFRSLYIAQFQPTTKSSFLPDLFIFVEILCCASSYEWDRPCSRHDLTRYTDIIVILGLLVVLTVGQVYHHYLAIMNGMT